MTTRTRTVGARAAILGLLLLAGGVSPLNSMVPPARAARPAARAAQARPKAAPRISSGECSELAFKASIAKARMQMRALFPAGSEDLAGITEAMNSDRRVSEKVQQAFGNSDLIKSEYSRGGDCVVTVKLPLERLQLLARGL